MSPNPPPLIYIAGPYRAPTTWEINVNITNARQWGVRFAKMGAYPVIPHSNTAHMDGAAADSLWLGGTLELLRRCDGAIFIPGWPDSKGSQAEWEEAGRLRIPRLDANVHAGSLTMDVLLRDWLEGVKVSMSFLHDTEGK